VSVPKKAVALNELAMFHFSQKDEKNIEAALKALKKIDMNGSDSYHKSIYHYNLGRVKEKLPSEGWKDKYDHFYDSVDSNPYFDDAIDKAYALLISKEKTEEAVTLSSMLVKRGRADKAMSEIHRYLLKCGDKKGSEQILPVLVGCYGQTGMTASEFEKTERIFLQRIFYGPTAGAQMTRDIEEIYLKKLTPTLDQAEIERRYQPWIKTCENSEAFSRFTKKVADMKLRELDKKPSKQIRSPDSKGALARYAIAWAVDSSNFEAGLYLTSTLRDYEAKLELEPQAYKAWIAQIGKAADFDKNLTQDDLEYKLRTHVILAQVLEKKNEDNPVTALAQYKLALQTEQKIQRESRVRYPGLHMRAANCYQRLNDRLPAWDHYVTAAEFFVLNEQRPDAEFAISRTQNLKIDLDKTRASRLRRVVEGIEKLEKGKGTP
jgi:hypothetical protein